MKGKQNGHVNRKKKLRSDFLLIQLTRNNRTKKSVLVHKNIILTEKILNQIKQDFNKSCQI